MWEKLRPAVIRAHPDTDQKQSRVVIKKPTQKKPPKKTQKNPPKKLKKKPQKKSIKNGSEFFKFLIYENNKNFFLSNRFFMNK